MKRGFLMLLVLWWAGVMPTWAQPSNDSLNLRKLGHYPVSQWGPLGASPLCNDVWGYFDSAASKEYAIVGNRNGVLVADVTNPAAVSNALWVPGVPSVWRDIKTWGHFAYAVHDIPTGTSQTNGLLVINLDSMTHKFVRLPVTSGSGAVDTLRRAHNLWVDEQGRLFAFGSNVQGGGAVIVDVATDPWNPSVLGAYSTYYLHDGYVRHDTLYGAALWEDIQVIGVALPNQPVTFGRFATPSSFAHNCWLSDDGATLFTTDEVSGGYVAAYDVRNLSNVDEYFRHRTQEGSGVIPHNAHVAGRHVVTSYYTFGCHVLDVEFPELPVLVAYYDTSPNFSGNGFNGAWGAYPYLPSGRVLVSDIETGLWILEPEYPDVSRAEVQLMLRFGGTGGMTSYDSTMANNLGLPHYAVWQNSGDTVWADASGRLRIAQVGSVQDSLVWPSFSGNPASVGRAYALGSGLFVKDTLVADYYWSIPEPDFVWSVVAAADAWELRTVQPMDPATWSLRSIDGRTLLRDQEVRQELRIPYPHASGVYVLETTDAQGRRWTQKLLRP